MKSTGMRWPVWHSSRLHLDHESLIKVPSEVAMDEPHMDRTPPIIVVCSNLMFLWNNEERT